MMLRNKMRTKVEGEEMYIHNRERRFGKNKEGQRKEVFFFCPKSTQP